MQGLRSQGESRVEMTGEEQTTKYINIWQKKIQGIIFTDNHVLGQVAIAAKSLSIKLKGNTLLEAGHDQHICLCACSTGTIAM